MQRRTEKLCALRRTCVAVAVTEFEESSFVPCPADRWFLPGDSLELYLYDARSAWVTFSDQLDAASIPWPPREDHVRVSRPLYVAFRGTIVGPKPAGHMGVSAFQLTVDSVLVMREAEAGDCK